MSIPSLSLLEDLRQGIASLANRVDSLPRRFVALQGVFTEETARLAADIAAAGREAAFDCGVMASNVAKALECAAEEARVRAAQLEASAMLLEREAEDGEETGAVVPARALLSYSPDAALTRSVAVAWDVASLCCALEAAVCTRNGVDPLLSTVSGDGLSSYEAGDWDNIASVAVVDAEGDVLESIEAEDVDVSLGVEGANVMVTVREAGVVEVTYRTPVPDSCVDPVTLILGFTVCGVSLSGSPFTVKRGILGVSAILADVAPDRSAAFARELTAWLPRRSYQLLYRGSRDGMRERAFHRLCAGKGPTLVLVRCDKGWVFGGYADASWVAYPGGRLVASPDAFLMSVVGPHSTGPVKFPVVHGSAALYCSSICGPVFNGGLCVAGNAFSGAGPGVFDGTSYCHIGKGTVSYMDVLGKGECSLTGSENFFPAEIEVFAVTAHTA